ncbi:hypothetical protein GCM10010256_63970 [Streptomyces coeruleorubidus]|nr:hypothetical protein GCM10010256_63970 [Streptomyces coeruleorubidus]
MKASEAWSSARKARNLSETSGDDVSRSAKARETTPAVTPVVMRNALARLVDVLPKVPPSRLRPPVGAIIPLPPVDPMTL